MAEAAEEHHGQRPGDQWVPEGWSLQNKEGRGRGWEWGVTDSDLRILSVLFSADILISPADGSQSPHEPKETYLLLLITSPTVEQGVCVIGGNSKGLSPLSLGVKIPGPPFCRTVCLGLAAIGRANLVRTWCEEGQPTAALGLSLEAWPPTKSSPRIQNSSCPQI